MQTMRDQIVARIERLGEGKAFSAKDFLDIASRTTIDVALAEPDPQRDNPPYPAGPLRHAAGQSRARREVEPGH